MLSFINLFLFLLTSNSIRWYDGSKAISRLIMTVLVNDYLKNKYFYASYFLQFINIGLKILRLIIKTKFQQS